MEPFLSTDRSAQLRSLSGLFSQLSLEFEAVEVLVVVIGKLPEDRTVVEEVPEDPVACRLEHDDSLALGEHTKGIGLQREASKGNHHDNWI